MENLYQYFDSYVIELFEKDVMICKKINDSYVIIKSNGYDVIHKDMYENYALSIENLKIYSDIDLVNGFSMYEFILYTYIFTYIGFCVYMYVFLYTSIVFVHVF